MNQPSEEVQQRETAGSSAGALCTDAGPAWRRYCTLLSSVDAFTRAQNCVGDRLESAEKYKFVVRDRTAFTSVGRWLGQFSVLKMTLAAGFLLLIACIAELHSANANTEARVQDDAQRHSTETLANLYTVIKNVALPPPSADATGSEPTQQRLVLLMPGKVLSYYDYFPGDAYEAYLENPDYGYTDRQVTIPPRIMENMFALADIIPGRYPLRGAETGESMALIYESILNKMEVKGFDQKTQQEKERYVTAIDYLAEEIPDPLDVTKVVTRFQLYRRSQELYDARRLEMEEKIAEVRNSTPGIEFERWFQRNYPTLKSGVEGAYTEWLIFGQKEIVELYKSYLDVESPGVDLEEARMALRASGLSSLDRTRTVYPVSFVPSNFYRYLTNVTAV